MTVLDCFDEAFDEAHHYRVGPQQKLMLESLILPAPLDKESFSRWLAEIDLDAMDYPTLRLCSPLFKKFGGVLAGTPYYERLKGIYRYFHFRSNLVASAGRRAVMGMLDAKIDVVLFKGIAISLKYHGNTAIRPMTDMDVLIRRESLQQAEEVLRQHGYRYINPEKKKSTDVHAHQYINADYSSFDLHWYSLCESPHAGIDDGIWERAEFSDWGGRVVKVMSPEDLLLTGIVNGVRDYPIRPHWIHDVATIVDSEPVIPWAKVWEEARKRRVREQVFIALNLVRGISKETIPETVLENILENDLQFYRHLLKLAIDEGQTHELITAKLDEIEAARSPADKGSQPFARDRVNLSGSNPSGANLSAAPRRIRYFLDENKAIKGLFLKGRHLPLLAELFDVSDRQVLNDLVAIHPTHGWGHFAVPPGLLAAKLKPTLQTYGARIAVVDAPPSLVLLAGQIVEVTVEVENNTACCWPVCDGSLASFGLSYHLLSEDGNVLIWDTPRSILCNPRISHVSFIEPSQVLTCMLKVVAPSEPGRYVVQLDLAQDGVRWFAQSGHQFPRIDLEVLPDERPDYYVVNGPGIVHENMDGETVITNTRKGSYYTASGYASLIWNAIVDGYGESRIISAFAAAAIFPADEKVVERFIDSLVAERLITPSETGERGRRGDFRVDGRFGTLAPVLGRHPEPRELIAMDPVRGASKQAGWPHPPTTSDSVSGTKRRARPEPLSRTPAAQPSATSLAQVHRALGRAPWNKALSDIAEGWRRRELWQMMALQDIRQRYQRSVIGPFWITLSMGVMIGALGLLYGTIFTQDMNDYMPFLAAGFILWGLISGLIIEGTRAFTGVEGLIRQLPAPLTIYVYRLLWSNLITFAHNASIYVLVCLWYGLNPGWTALLALPALLVLLLNGFWMALLLGLLSARFRDIPLVVASVVQVLFFITTIIWKPDMLPGRAWMLDLNPFHHLIEILRAPLLGQVPSLENWVAVIIVTFVGWAVALWFFSVYRWRLAYWV
jgi:ABC-2 type transport system permease protein/lipopolysaccharide transport system permease protein